MIFEDQSRFELKKTTSLLFNLIAENKVSVSLNILTLQTNRIFALIFPIFERFWFRHFLKSCFMSYTGPTLIASLDKKCIV